MYGNRIDASAEGRRGAEIAEVLHRMSRAKAPRIEILGERPRADSVGLVSGSFDPMTVAHAALADALHAELVLLVVSPATLEKELGAEPPLLDLEARAASLLAYASDRPAVRVAVASGGLYADQVEAAAATFPEARLILGLGSDKVVQLFDPRYYEDREEALDRLFARAEIRFAMRRGDEDRVRATLDREPRWASMISPLTLPPDLARVSSGDVRRALRSGEDVNSLVPAEIIPFVREA